MEAWVLFAVAAAAAQTLRFSAQKHLRATRLSTGGATFARFFYSAPLVLVLAVIYAQGLHGGLPAMTGAFWAHALVGGFAQILATMCVVALFQHRNFAVGITFKKSEVLLTAVVGWVVLGDVVTPLGWAALGAGLFGVILLSDPPKGASSGARIFNRATGLGLGSGLCFAVSGVGYRGATLALGVDDLVLRAGWTLAMVTSAQLIGLGLWLAWRERGQIAAVMSAWRAGLIVGLFSLLGSFCWFAAFSLQSAAYVFAVGQIELIFSLAIGAFFFRERTSRREIGGMAVLTLSIIAIVMAS